MTVKEVMRTFVSSKILRGLKFTLNWKRYRYTFGHRRKKEKIRSLKICVVEMFNDIFPRNNCIREETVHA